MSLFGQEMLVENYFTSVLGAPALNMGVFVGIIAGFVGGVVYNKYYNFRKLPDALSFFNGKRFVPMSLKAGIGADIIHFVICCAAFLAWACGSITSGAAHPHRYGRQRSFSMEKTGRRYPAILESLWKLKTMDERRYGI